jgi:hypothetical protein
LFFLGVLFSRIYGGGIYEGGCADATPICICIILLLLVSTTTLLLLPTYKSSPTDNDLARHIHGISPPRGKPCTCSGRFKGFIIRVQCRVCVCVCVRVYDVYDICTRRIHHRIRIQKQVRFSKNKPNLISRGDTAVYTYIIRVRGS